jgi:hypothetical protein
MGRIVEYMHPEPRWGKSLDPDLWQIRNTDDNDDDGILFSYRESLLPGPRQTKPRGGAAVPYTPYIYLK